MARGREAVEGRARGRWWLGVALGAVVLAALPVVSASLDAGPGPGGTLEPLPVPTGGLPESAVAGLHGRLAYVTGDPRHPDRQRLTVLDLVTGELRDGPRVPSVSHVLAAGPSRTWLLLLGRDGADAVAYLLRDLAPGTRPAEVARGDVLALSPDGTTLLLVEGGAEPAAGCGSPSFTLRRLDLATGRQSPSFVGPVPCGALHAATVSDDGTPLVTVSGPQGLPGTYALRATGAEPLFDGSRLGSSGALLFALDDDRVVWPGGALDLALRESRLIGTIVGWSADGRHLAVDGRVGADVGLWLVDVTARRAHPIARDGYPIAAGLADGAVDDAGTLFSAGPGGILALTASALFPLDLPEDAPAPVRPIAWIP
jgi:hypothetical protein